MINSENYRITVREYILESKVTPLKTNNWRVHVSLREKCPNTEFFLIRICLYSAWIRVNTDQKKLLIWTRFTQCQCPIRHTLVILLQIVVYFTFVCKNNRLMSEFQMLHYSWIKASAKNKVQRVIQEIMRTFKTLMLTWSMFNIQR